MALVWTIADVRYRFRIATAPIPVHLISISVVAFVGVATLLTDLWRAEHWLVPVGRLLTPASWQAILAGSLLVVFLLWVWFALVRPPVFGRLNANRYARTLYQIILKGSASDLPVIAGELAFSAKSLIQWAPDRHAWKHLAPAEREQHWKSIHLTSQLANELLLLIGDKRFCKAVVESSPVTALALFEEMGRTGKHGASIHTFGRNLVSAAIKNRDSFIYFEAEGYESGLLGYHKALTQAMFGNHRLVEAVGTLLDPAYKERRAWAADQWEAYCRVVLMTLESHIKDGQTEHSYSLYRAKREIQEACNDLRSIDGVADDAWNHDLLERLGIITHFVNDAIELLDKAPLLPHATSEVRKTSIQDTWYDHAAEMIAELVWSASAVSSPRDLCWQVQHNTVWSRFFNFGHSNGPAAQLIKTKALGLMFEEIAEMTTFPNFKGARILAITLNVMGLKVSTEDYYKDTRDFHEQVIAWVSKHYSWLHAYNPRIAEACLVSDLTYDPATFTLTKTAPAEGIRREPHIVDLRVDPPPTPTAAPSTDATA